MPGASFRRRCGSRARCRCAGANACTTTCGGCRTVDDACAPLADGADGFADLAVTFASADVIEGWRRIGPGPGRDAGAPQLVALPWTARTTEGAVLEGAACALVIAGDQKPDRPTLTAFGRTRGATSAWASRSICRGPRRPPRSFSTTSPGDGSRDAPSGRAGRGFPPLHVEFGTGASGALLRPGTRRRRDLQCPSARAPLGGEAVRPVLPSRAFHSPWRPDRLAQNPPDSPSRTRSACAVAARSASGGSRCRACSRATSSWAWRASCSRSSCSRTSWSPASHAGAVDLRGVRPLLRDRVLSRDTGLDLSRSWATSSPASTSRSC
jgi:hypothetical protein